MTHEQRLARTLRKVGPFVAVGDPTEELPQLGAARVYAADEDWQTTVDELTARAGAVLLQTGDSDGLAWEVDHVVALGAPERMILALPPPGGRRAQAPGATTRSGAGSATLFPRRLPESIGHCTFAYFDTDWTPRLLGKRGVPLPAGDRAARYRAGAAGARVQDHVGAALGALRRLRNRVLRRRWGRHVPHGRPAIELAG